VNKLNSSLPNEADKTSELSWGANKLNSNLPKEANETSKLPTEAKRKTE